MSAPVDQAQVADARNAGRRSPRRRQRPLRVAVVAEWYPSSLDPVHGIWAHRQALAVRELGVEVRVLALRRPVPPLRTVRALGRFPPDPAPLRSWLASQPTLWRTEELDGIPITPVPLVAPPRPWSYGSWGWWIAPTLGRALRALRARWPFDLVHAHNVVPTAHATVLSELWRSGVPVVASTHGPDVIKVPERGPLARRALKTALTRCDLVLANSRWAAERCRALAGLPLATRVVHLGADLPDPHELPPKHPRLTIVTVAHLQARKRHETVLQALFALRDRLRVDYLVIGDGEERPRLERLVAELGLGDRVRFLGQLPHSLALAEMRRCHAFVMPSVEEPFGVAYVEAMAAGLPVIASAGEGGPEDIATAGGGILLVPPGDHEATASAILRALGPEREQLGRAARETVRANFTWRRCGERTVAAYRELLEGPPATTERENRGSAAVDGVR